MQENRFLAALRVLNRHGVGSSLSGERQRVLAGGDQCPVLLATDLGRINFIGQIGTGWDYAGLLSHSSEIALLPDLTVRVLDLETIIASKEVAANEKDLAVLPLLRRTLTESRRLEATQTPPPRAVD